jgi:phospholipid/cholesterol/gamma-HCH transport system substrate-binding protein
MKSSRINYFLVGSFVLLALVGIVVGMATLSGRSGDSETYYTIYKNVSGVKTGTKVLYEGFHMGEVSNVKPQLKQGKMQFRVDINVREGWKIPEDSVMNIATSGLLAAASLAITAGESKKMLKPGDQLAGKEQVNVFAAISSVAQEMKELSETSLKPLLSTVNKTVGSMGAILGKDGQVLFHELGNLARDLSERAPQIVDNVEQFTARMKRVSGQLNELASNKNRVKFEGAVEKMDVAAGNFARLSASLGQTQTKLDSLVTNVNIIIGDNKLDVQKTIIDMRYVMDSLARHIDSVNQNMEEAARNMKVFSRQIRKNPGLLLSGAQPEQSVPQ